MAKKAKKPKSETRQKTVTAAFRVTPEEKEELTAAAEAAGLTFGTFCRVTMLKKSQTMPKRRPAADLVILGQVLGQLGKLGNNLNQIAKRLNERKGVDPARAVLAFKEITSLKESILKALRRPNDCEGQEREPHGEPL